MSFKGEFFGAIHPELQEAEDNFTTLLLKASQMPGITRMNHSITRDFDAQHPLPGLKR